MLVCCQVTFLILLCLLFGFLLGLYLDEHFAIGGLSGLWNQVKGQFNGGNNTNKGNLFK